MVGKSKNIRIVFRQILRFYPKNYMGAFILCRSSVLLARKIPDEGPRVVL